MDLPLTLIFLFSNIIPKKSFNLLNIIFYKNSTSRNTKLKKLSKFSFVAVLADFCFKFCFQNVQHFKEVPLKCPRQLDIMLSSYVEEHVKKIEV